MRIPSFIPHDDDCQLTSKHSYFNREALETVFFPSPVHSKYINRKVLERFMPVGGARIEDDLLITKDGWEILTTAAKGEAALRIIRGEA
jgi:hypothetical protein